MVRKGLIRFGGLKPYFSVRLVSTHVEVRKGLIRFGGLKLCLVSTLETLYPACSKGANSLRRLEPIDKWCHWVIREHKVKKVGISCPEETMGIIT